MYVSYSDTMQTAPPPPKRQPDSSSEWFYLDFRCILGPLLSWGLFENLNCLFTNIVGFMRDLLAYLVVLPSYFIVSLAWLFKMDCSCLMIRHWKLDKEVARTNRQCGRVGRMRNGNEESWIFDPTFSPILYDQKFQTYRKAEIIV